MLEICNIYFMKKDFTEKQAQRWIKSHNYKLKIKDLHKGQYYPTQWRYNQMPKTKFKRFVTKILPNKVHMIFGVRI
jgi:hypothetical protein